MQVRDRVIVHASRDVREMFGRELRRIGQAALEVLLSDSRSLSVAHRQIVHRGEWFVFSSRIGAFGDLVIDVDLGDPGLAGRIIYEDELKAAAKPARQARAALRDGKARRR